MLLFLLVTGQLRGVRLARLAVLVNGAVAGFIIFVRLRHGTHHHGQCHHARLPGAAGDRHFFLGERLTRAIAGLIALALFALP